MRKRIFAFGIGLIASGYASFWGGMLLGLFWPLIITLGVCAKREMGLAKISTIVSITLGVLLGVLPSWISNFEFLEAISLAILSAMLFPLGIFFGFLSLKIFPIEEGKSRLPV
jgi:hypothetical protein